MAIIKQYHKDTDTTYVYESISYWDEEKKQSRSKRRVIGKVDPQTGEIVPTGRRGRKPKDGGDGAAAGESAMAELAGKYELSQARIKELTLLADKKDLEIAALKKELQSLKEALKKTDKHLEACRVLYASALDRS